eukprot:RCo001833
MASVGHLIHVHVVGARNLTCACLSREVSPYVSLRLGDTTFKTKTRKKARDPVWGETFTFPASAAAQESVLRLQCYDLDSFCGAGHLLCSVEVDLRRLAPNALHTLRLEPNPSAPGGSPRARHSSAEQPPLSLEVQLLVVNWAAKE